MLQLVLSFLEKSYSSLCIVYAYSFSTSHILLNMSMSIVIIFRNCLPCFIIKYYSRFFKPTSWYNLTGKLETRVTSHTWHHSPEKYVFPDVLLYMVDRPMCLLKYAIFQVITSAWGTKKTWHRKHIFIIKKSKIIIARRNVLSMKSCATY